jgi:uncharacterized protein YcbX
MSIRIASLYRYPVKGLSPERLQTALLSAGAYVPGDRMFAIENGPSGFDPGRPEHQPKIKFLMLMRNECLARLETRYEDGTGTLTIMEGGREAARGDLGTPAGRLSIEAFFRRFMPAELQGAPKVLAAPDGFRFTDSSRGFVSLINLASVEALETLIAAPVDPLRFRANIYFEGLAPWAELDLVGRTLAAENGTRLKITKRIVRCAATDVDPSTGERDLQIPKTLMKTNGHCDCGVYAEVLSGGSIDPGTVFTIAPEV